jgi:hypothetical protein
MPIVTQQFETLRLSRIKNAMTHAAQSGTLYHLWWHPHNMLVRTDESFQLLTDVLDHFAYLRATHQMRSMGVSEIAMEVRQVAATTSV